MVIVRPETVVGRHRAGFRLYWRLRSQTGRIGRPRIDAEVRDYASTTKEIDYDKYLGYAGLTLEEPTQLPDAYLGAIVEDVNGKLVISAIEGGLPAQRARLAVNDEIKTLDGDGSPHGHSSCNLDHHLRGSKRFNTQLKK